MHTHSRRLIPEGRAVSDAVAACWLRGGRHSSVCGDHTSRDTVAITETPARWKRSSAPVTVSPSFIRLLFNFTNTHVSGNQRTDLESGADVLPELGRGARGTTSHEAPRFILPCMLLPPSQPKGTLLTWPHFPAKGQ